jgi:VanZ family protein
MTHISTSTAQKWALWLTGLGVAIATVLMLAPMPDMPQAPKSTDKLAHVVMFFGLCLPAVLTGLAPWGWVVAGMGAFGLAIETLQPFVGRQFDLVDLAAVGRDIPQHPAAQRPEVVVVDRLRQGDLQRL